MAKKGRTVGIAEKPLYQFFAQAMLDGKIAGWTVAKPGEWEIFYDGAKFEQAHKLAEQERELLTLAEATQIGHALGFEGAAPKAKQAGKAELLAFVQKAALLDGPLAAEAAQLLKAA